MERRTFLKWATHGLGALFATLMGVPAVAYLVDARNRPGQKKGFRTVATLKDLPVGQPHQVVIRDIRHDAWTLHPNDVVGRVWLIKRDEEKVDAFTTICPHLGCSINYQDGKEGKPGTFLCPCHGASFQLDGSKIESPGTQNPAPRGMDRLECRRDPDNPELVQVEYLSFRQGEHTPILKA